MRWFDVGWVDELFELAHVEICVLDVVSNARCKKARLDGEIWSSEGLKQHSMRKPYLRTDHRCIGQDPLPS